METDHEELVSQHDKLSKDHAHERQEASARIKEAETKYLTRTGELEDTVMQLKDEMQQNKKAFKACV